MPFKEPEMDSLHEEIVEIAGAYSVELTRADDIFDPGIIIDQILESIDGAHVLIAVCTGKNANVFFELGYSWRRHRPILLAESKEDLPFDVQSYRTIMYGDQVSRVEGSWKGDLGNAISAVLSQGPKVNTPNFSIRLERIDSNGHFGGYRLYIRNTGNTPMHNIRIELFDVVNRGLVFDDGEQDESVKDLGSYTLGVGKEYPVFMRCDNRPHHLTFKFKVSGMDTSGEVHSFDLWEDLPVI